MTQSTITALRAAAEARDDSATADLMREAADALERFQWRSIASAPTEMLVLVYRSGGVLLGYKDTLGNWRGRHRGEFPGSPKSPPRFWMPLPPPPKREG